MTAVSNKLLTPVNARRIFLGLTKNLIGLGLIAGLSTGCSNIVNRPTDIARRPLGQPYNSTVYEFRFGPKTRTVADPHNKLRWVSGDLPDTISVSEGKRLVIYDSPGAIIKSKNDSVEVRHDSVKYGGYMGIQTKSTYFSVGPEGIITE